MGGTGLGLSLTKALVEMLGGEVRVGSEPGRGSTFAVSLPATYVEPVPVEADAVPVDEPAGDVANRELVLVVDDDADTRERLRSFLERDGWTVREGEHGREGLDRLAERLPILVLLDLTMPVMDGFTFLAERAQADQSAWS